MFCVQYFIHSNAKSRAFHYAKNVHGQSRYKAVLLTRVTLGEVYRSKKEHHNFIEPPRGYDSVSIALAYRDILSRASVDEGKVQVEGVASRNSDFHYPENVVYHENALLPLVLLILRE